MIGRWRVRWAEKENARRRSAYDAWGHEDADLRSMRSAAASYHGESAADYPGERVYLTVAGAHSVEAPGVGAIPPLGAPFTPPSAPTGPVPAGFPAGGEGTAVVTSRRLLFFGPGYTREWRYEALTGLMDDARAPVTLLRTGGEAPSGVVIPSAAAKGFRFNLRLAVADAFGDRPGLVAQIDQLIAWHQQQRPIPPVPADPAQAPALAWWSPLRTSLVGALALVLLLCVVGLFLPSAPPKADPHDAAKIGSTATGVAAPAAGDAAPAASAVPTSVVPTSAVPTSSVPTSSVPPTSAVLPTTAVPPTSAAARATTAAPRPTASKTKPKPKPTTKPPAKPKPVDLCGAPRNPFGYNFCGGSHITSPNSDTCSYFSCIGAFWDGKGYMEQCSDGMVSMSGGRSGSCSSHGGNRRPVYRR